MKRSVLFICVHNSARSQMAEALLNHYCPEDFAAESAGIEAGDLNPYAVQAMSEIGINISGKFPRKVFEVVKTGKVFAHAVSLCDEANEGRCPILPRHGKRHHWAFPDPASSAGTEAEKLERMRRARDLISRRVQEWCAEEYSKPTSGAI
jgi:arsenate reductase